MTDSKDAVFHEFAATYVPRLQALLLAEEKSLLDAARQRRGRLTLDEIRTVCRQNSQNRIVLERSLSDLVREFELWRRSRATSESRQNLVGRVVIYPLEHLCEGHHGGGVRQGAISRRVIPAFLRASAFLVGSRHVEIWQAQLHEILESNFSSGRDSHDPALWRAFYAHPSVQRITLEHSARVLSRFQPYAKRREWLLAYVNDAMSQHVNQRPGPVGDETWRFEERHYLAMMDASTLWLRRSLRSHAGKQVLGEFLSREKLLRLRTIVGRVEKEIGVAKVSEDD